MNAANIFERIVPENRTITKAKLKIKFYAIPSQKKKLKQLYH